MGETTARATAAVGDLFDVVVRPRAALLRSTALSIVLSAVPLAVALVWVSFPLRTWAVVATFVIVIALLTAATFVRLRTAFVGVGSGRVEFRGIIGGNRTVHRPRIDRVVVASTFTSSVDRLTREFVALDLDGSPLFRLRGVLWDEDAIARVVGALEVQVTDHLKPLPLREFLQQYPDDRPWPERRSGLLIALLATGALVAVVLAAELSGWFGR